MYKMVRILPMDKKEFNKADIQEVQEHFFLNELPKRKDHIGQAKYYYKKQGMKIEEGKTLVLFQYDGKIIAMARLCKIVRFRTSEGDYHGAYYFKPDTIIVFEPLTNEDINQIFECNIKFGQVKHSLNPDKIPILLKQLKKVKSVDL